MMLEFCSNFKLIRFGREKLIKRIQPDKKRKRISKDLQKNEDSMMLSNQLKVQAKILNQCLKP